MNEEKIVPRQAKVLQGHWANNPQAESKLNQWFITQQLQLSCNYQNVRSGYRSKKSSHSSMAKQVLCRQKIHRVQCQASPTKRISFRQQHCERLQLQPWRVIFLCWINLATHMIQYKAAKQGGCQGIRLPCENDHLTQCELTLYRPLFGHKTWDFLSLKAL